MNRISDILAACLEDIAAGKATVEECLARHAGVRDELEPLLRLGLDVEALPRVAPTNAFKATARAVLMEHIHTEQASREKRFAGFSGFLRPVWVRSLVIALIAAIVLSGAGAGTVFAAGDSLPGDTLYTVKTGWEDVRDWLETDVEKSAALQMEFAGRRLDEIDRLLGTDPERISLAISGYEDSLWKALRRGNLITLISVAQGITGQMDRIDSLEDIAGDTGPIGQVRESAMKYQIMALRPMAQFDTATAGNLTVTVMVQRMQRAADAISHGRYNHGEEALGQYLAYAGLCEEIRQAAGETGASLDDIYASACESLQQQFVGVAGDVSPALAEKIENTFRNMRGHRYGQDDSPGTGAENGQGQGQGQGNGAASGNQGQGNSNSSGQGNTGQSSGEKITGSQPDDGANNPVTPTPGQEPVNTPDIGQTSIPGQTNGNPPEIPGGPDQGQGQCTDSDTGSQSGSKPE